MDQMHMFYERALQHGKFPGLLPQIKDLLTTFELELSSKIRPVHK